MTRIELAQDDVVGIRAANPSPFTLSGTNTWIVRRDPAWLVDPGPALTDHLDALEAEVRARGGLGGIALTHDHADHAEAVPALRERFPDARLAASRGAVDVLLGETMRSARCARCARPATRPITSPTSSTASRSPETQCSVRAACSSIRIRARSPAIWPRCSACASARRW